MAQFDVYQGARGRGYLLDCQSDLLYAFGTRVVVPLLPASGIPEMARLNPVFEIEGALHIMTTQLVFAIPSSALGQPFANLSEKRGAIIAAIDMLWSGV